MKVSEKHYDEVFNFKGQWDMPSACGLKIIEKQGKKQVIVTELYQENPGTSVTYAGRSLAEQICKARGLDFGAIAYFECNPDTDSKLSFYDEEYFEVTFNNSPRSEPQGYPPGAPQPVYRRLSVEEVKGLLGV